MIKKSGAITNIPTTVHITKITVLRHQYHNIETIDAV